jgi:phage tail protein X
MLEPIAENLWSLPQILPLPGGVRMPVRMGVIRLPTGELLLHSPVAIDDATAAELNRLGTVAHVIAPCLIHHLYVRPTLDRWPQARLHAPPGLAKKRPDLPAATALTAQPPALWGDSVDQVHIEGAPTIDEWVFFHRASGTILTADFLFNIERPANLSSSLLFHLTGVNGRLAQSRAWRLFTKNRAAARSSAQRVLAWPFTRLHPSHGNVAEQAHDRAEKALRWMTS